VLPTRREAPKDHRGLFVASSLSRAVCWKVPADKLVEGEKEAVERWTSGHLPMSTRAKALVMKLVRNVFTVTNCSKYMAGIATTPVPLPPNTGCIDTTRREGGLATALRRQSMMLSTVRWNDGRVVLPPRDATNPWSLPDVAGYLRARSLAPTHLRLVLPQVRGHVLMTTRGHTVLLPRAERAVPRPDAGIDVAVPEGRYINDCILMSRQVPYPRIKPLALKERGGKIRVASIHDPHDAWLGQVLTNAWLPVLKRLGTTQAMLRGKEIKLRANRPGKEEHFLYSADLKAATDYVGHDLARFVWKLMCLCPQSPFWFLEAGTYVLGPKLVEGGGITSRGVHMGLGLSWIVLCLLNMAAAHGAGALRESYAICGDDLIGYWSKTVADKYEANLREMGLEPNLTKSFRGPRGVFCERIVEVDPRSPWIARSTSLLGLAEAGGAKAISGLSGDKVNAISQLRCRRGDRYLGRLVDHTLRTHKVFKLPEGSAAHYGGGGVGTIKPQQVLALLRMGCMPASEGTEPAIEVMMRSLRQNGMMHSKTKKGHAYVALSDLLVTVKKAVRSSRAYMSPVENVAKQPRTPQEHRQEARRLLRRVPARVTQKTIVSAIKTSQHLTSVARRRLLAKLRWYGFTTLHFRRAVENAVHPPERWVPYKEALRQAQFLSATGLGMDGRTPTAPRWDLNHRLTSPTLSDVDARAPPPPRVGEQAHPVSIRSRLYRKAEESVSRYGDGLRSVIARRTLR
jgi:hypothetical protein